MSGEDTSVQVALRIRPQSASERIEMCQICTNVTPGHPQVVLGKDKAFTYDLVFDINSKQESVYQDCIDKLIEGCFDGYNATVLAYGQTGAGKTYTMGTGFDVNLNAEDEGIVPRAVQHLFTGIEKRKQLAIENNEPQPDFKVLVQFMELYNEDLNDLFDSDHNRGGGGKNIKIHEDTNGSIYTVGVTMKSVASARETLLSLQQGALSRTTASTNMNAQSSRSHAIFTIHVNQQRVVKMNEDEVPTNTVKGQSYEYELLTAKFNFVDLAGSERLKRTGATGDRAKEGISINCGLLALGNVISALGDKAKRGSHVPYRDSKLTRLLQDSLGGNSLTLMIACVSPSDRDFMETLNTLKYANRARNIKNKVMVNQDKASKQIATLRAEIQELMMELNEYRQGKRLAGEGEEHMSDMCHENTMLQTENDKLRMRIKALNQTVGDQKMRITDMIAQQSIALLNGDVKTGVEELITGYVKEIEELRSRLIESDAMASAVARRSVLTASRLGHVNDDTAISILEIAKRDLNNQKKKVKKMEGKVISGGDDGVEKVQHILDSNGNDTRKDGEVIHGSDGEAKDDSDDDDINFEDELNRDESEGIGDDEDKHGSDSSSDGSDDEEGTGERQEDQETQLLREGLTELSTEISIKEKLIEELESSQKRLNTMKVHYEEKLSLLQCKIKETENERDQVLQTIQQHDKEAVNRSQKVKDDYEKKINNFKTELQNLQAAKKEHNKLVRTKTKNEQQLKVLSRELDEMKKTRVKLMKQMKEEMAANKKREAARVREISQLKKESRKRELQIKNMESEKKQRELVLRRKQEEVKHLRLQQKPISGKLGKQRKNNTLSLPSVEPELSLTATNMTVDVQPAMEKTDKSSTTLLQQKNARNARNVRGTGIPVLGMGKSDKITSNSGSGSDSKTKTVSSTGRRLSGTQASKTVKKTWESIEKQMEHIVAHHQTLSTMEAEMERWIGERDRLTKRMESCYHTLEEAKSKNDEEISRDINDQLEALKAHMDYVQENISEAQTEIADMEEEGETTSITEAITKCSMAESKLLMEHFLTKVLQLGQDTVAKDATVKELEAKIEALRQQNDLQQDLLMHVLQQPDAEQLATINGAPSSEKTAVNGGPTNLPDELQDKSRSLTSVDGEIPATDNNKNITTTTTQHKQKEKARRRTAIPEELLYHMRQPEPKKEPVMCEDIKESVSSDIKPLNSSDLMQKLMKLEKARNDTTASITDSISMPPPTLVTSQDTTTTTTTTTTQERNRPLPATNSFLRGTFKSKSARTFTRLKSSASNTSIASSVESRSQPTSPTNTRKSYDDKTKLSSIPDEVSPRRNSRNENDNVFSRLTSTLPQDSNPDRGRMIPVKSPTGKPGVLTCLYASSGHNSAVLSLCVNETTMYTGSKDRTVKIWDIEKCQEIMSLAQHKRDVTSLKFCEQTNLLFSVSHNLIKMWDVRSSPAKCVKSITSGGITSDSVINDLAVNHTGTMVFAASGNSVKIWDMKTYQLIGKLVGHAGHVMTLLLLGREEPYLMLTGSRDHYIKLFEINETLSGTQNKTQHRLKNPHKKKFLKSSIQTFEPPHYDGVQSLALHGDNLFSGSRDNSIKKWDLATQSVQQNLISAHKDWVSSLNILRSHDVLVSGCRGGILNLWEPTTCQHLGEIKAHRHPINAIATNSSFVFTASSDRLIRVWKATDVLNEALGEISQNQS